MKVGMVLLFMHLAVEVFLGTRLLRSKALGCNLASGAIDCELVTFELRTGTCNVSVEGLIL